MLQMQWTICPWQGIICGHKLSLVGKAGLYGVLCISVTDRCRRNRPEIEGSAFEARTDTRHGYQDFAQQHSEPVSHKELGHCRDNQGAVCDTFERIGALALALWPWCHGDGLCPQHPTVWKFLQSARRL